VDEARKQFGNRDEWERPPLEAVARRLVKALAVTTNLYVMVIHKV
jgi:hypothetical protein